MKICQRCGASCPDEAAYCSLCGASMAAGYTPPQSGAPNYSQGYPQQPSVQYQPYQQNPGWFQPLQVRKAPLTLGIVGAVFALLLPLVTYCCSIPGLVMAISDYRRLRAAGMFCSPKYIVLNGIALGVAAVNSLLGVLLYTSWLL